MCCFSVFTSIMAIIWDFPIIYIFRELFLRFFFHKFYIHSHLDVILVLLLLMATIFSSDNQLHFLRVLLKINKTFSYNPFRNIKYVCFLCDQIPKLLKLKIHKEYSYLFLLFKNFLDWLHIHIFFRLKIQCQHK